MRPGPVRCPSAGPGLLGFCDETGAPSSAGGARLHPRDVRAAVGGHSVGRAASRGGEMRRESFLHCDCAVAGLTGADGRPVHDPACRWVSAGLPVLNQARGGNGGPAEPIGIGEDRVDG